LYISFEKSFLTLFLSPLLLPSIKYLLHIYFLQRREIDLWGKQCVLHLSGSHILIWKKDSEKKNTQLTF
jgi:hypothetical protein